MDSVFFGRNIFKFLVGYVLTLEIVCSGSKNGGAADMTRLIKTIFDGHISRVLPRVDQSRPINVHIGMGVIAIEGLDTKLQVLTLTAFLRMSWRDETLSWSPEDYGNITSIPLPQGDVWTPDMAVINSLSDNIFPGNNGVKIRVSHDGWVDWVPVFNTQLYCQVDSVKYPNDVDNCVLKLGSWMYDDSEVHVEHMAGHTQLDPDVTNGQFHVSVDDPELALEERDGVLYSSLHFNITMERRPGYTILCLLLPMFVIGLLTVLSFMIPADNDEKVDMSLNVMLSTTMFLSVIHDDLPDRSDSIATIAMYVIALFLMSFLGVVGNTVVRMMSEKEEAQKETREPKYLSLSSGDNSKDKKVSPVFLRKPFTPTQRMPKSVSSAEVTPDPAHETFDQSEGADSLTHSIHVVSGSKAATVNLVFLVLSALALFIVSLISFVKIFS